MPTSDGEDGQTQIVPDAELKRDGRGGKRPGAGTKRGRLWRRTMEKALVREETRKLIQRHLPAMLRSQIAHAIGIGHLYTRDDHGKFSRIVDQDEMDRLLSQGVQDHDYWIFSKDPSVQAFAVLLDRTLDQAPKPIELTGPGGQPLELSLRLTAARGRVKKA